MANPKKASQIPQASDPEPQGTRSRSSQYSCQEESAKFQADKYASKRNRLWIASLPPLIMGVIAFLFLTYQLNTQYDRFRKVAAGRMDVGIEHRRLVPSDLNANAIYADARGRFKREVSVRLMEEGETLLIIKGTDGKLLEKRRIRESDLNPTSISIKHLRKIGETGNQVRLIYDSDGVAQLVVSHRDN